VQLGEHVDESVVVLAFLRAELDSSRFGAAQRAALRLHDADDALVRDADVHDVRQNRVRRAVLDTYRGDYLGRNLDGLAWRRATLTREELLAVRYIAWDYWLEITGGSRLPTDAAQWHRARGETDVYEPERAPAPLILVRADAASHLMVVEGHGRLTAISLDPERVDTLDVLLGEGESIRGWSLY
jgi:hypothetical protein